jgi:hypothetical protein
MNDDEVITLVRAQRDSVPMTFPVDEIIRRGRAARTRRLIPRAAGAFGDAAGVALAVTVLTPASHNAAHQIVSQGTSQGTSHNVQPEAQLAAWMVTKLPDGDISVTVRQLQNPAGLQSTLLADGVPATVTFDQQLNSACRSYPEGTPGPPGQISSLLTAVFPKPYQDMPTPPAGPPRMVPAGSAPPP